MLQLKKFPDISDSTGEEARESRRHPEEPRFHLLAREEGSCPCVVGKEVPVFLSQLKRRRSPQERREELQGRATIPRVPQMPQSIPGRRSLQANLIFVRKRDYKQEFIVAFPLSNESIKSGQRPLENCLLCKLCARLSQLRLYPNDINGEVLFAQFHMR